MSKIGDLTPEASPTCQLTLNMTAVTDPVQRSGYEKLASDWRSSVDAASNYALLILCSGIFKVAHAVFIALGCSGKYVGQCGAEEGEVGGLARIAKIFGGVASFVCFVYAIIFLWGYSDMEAQCFGTPELDKLDSVWTLVVVTMILSLGLCCCTVCGGVLILLLAMAGMAAGPDFEEEDDDDDE